MDINNRNSARLCLNVKRGHFEDVGELISNGANVNYRYFGGNTPLMIAILHRNTDFVNIFTEKYQASVFITNDDGKDAIDLVNKWGNPLAVKKVAKRALEETREMTHNDVFTAVVRIISEITGIKRRRIFPSSHLELDLELYEGNSYLLPDPKLWELLLQIERRFRLDSEIMDCKYHALFDPEINDNPTVWRLTEIIKAQIDSRKKIKA